MVQSGLQANEKKCVFEVQEIDFLGHKITRNQISPTEEKVKAIEKFQTPTDIESIRRFLGLINYYRDFIPKCLDISAPLNQLLRKNVEFKWNA